MTMTEPRETLVERLRENIAKVQSMDASPRDGQVAIDAVTMCHFLADDCTELLSALAAAEESLHRACSDAAQEAADLNAKIEARAHPAAVVRAAALEEAAKIVDLQLATIEREAPDLNPPGPQMLESVKEFCRDLAETIRSLSPTAEVGMVEKVARAIRTEMPEMFGSPEALADPKRVERFNKSSDQMAEKYARAALSALGIATEEVGR